MEHPVGGQVLGLTSSINAAVPALAQFSVPIRGSRASRPAAGRLRGGDAVCEQRATPAGVPVVVLTQVSPGSRWTPAAAV